MDEVTQEAVYRAEQSGIIFIDEIDKIASKNHGGSSADVSREGVQRDILPIVEGSTVVTKYGSVKTDYILFIAAGAFHMCETIRFNSRTSRALSDSCRINEVDSR